LAGTGLRIGEALAIGQGNTWDPEAGTVTVAGTLADGAFQPAPKTKAGKRVVDLPPEANVLLKALYPTEDARKGTLFPFSEDTYRRRFATLGIHGFHSLRRFRITHLQSQSVPTSLVKFWAGHAAGDITERYTKMGTQILERKAWSERAGLGFQLV
jgi:integrase